MGTRGSVKLGRSLLGLSRWRGRPARRVMRPIIYAVCFLLVLSNTVMPGIVWAEEARQIVIDGKTATTLVENGIITDVHTATVVGDNAFNSFERFNVFEGRIVNLHLPNEAQNLLNLVHSDRSYIEGVLNSVMEGQVGGDIYFLNPHGFIVGSEGVINTGALTVITPTQAFMDSFFSSPGNPLESAVTSVLEGAVPISPTGLISVQGTINATRNVELFAGDVAVSGDIASGAVFEFESVHFADVVNIGGMEAGQSMSVRGGDIVISATNDVTLTAGDDEEDTTGGTILSDGWFGDAGSITIDAGDEIIVGEDVQLSARGHGEDSMGGRVVVQAGRSAAFGPGADIDVRGGDVSGDGGSIEISAPENGWSTAASLLAAGALKANATDGQAGSILVRSNTIDVTSSLNLHGVDLTLDATGDSVGSGGSITVGAGVTIASSSGDIALAAAEDITSSGIVRTDGAAGVDAGSITLTAGRDIVAGANSLLSARGQGEDSSGGSVVVSAGESVLFAAGAQIDVRGGTSGDAGSIEISAPENGWDTAAAMLAAGALKVTAADGQAGSIAVRSDTIDVTASLDLQGADLTLEATGVLGGSGGSITIGGGISIVSTSGEVALTAATDITHSGVIRTDGTADADAGSIKLAAGNDITLGPGSLLSARGIGEDSSGGEIAVLAGRNVASGANSIIDVRGGDVSGSGGSIELSAPLNGWATGLAMFKAGALKASAVSGQAGSILIRANAIDISENLNTGAVRFGLEANENILIRDGVEITTRSLALRAAGQINLKGTVRADGSSNVNAGSIILEAGTNVLADADPLLSARGIGSNSSGGLVSVHADQNANFEAGAIIDVRGGDVSGAGGSIAFSANENGFMAGLEMLNRGAFKATATNGKAGSLLLRSNVINVADNVYSDGLNLTLQANQTMTVNGAVTLSTRDLANVATGDHMTAASTGDSGKLTLAAPRITIGGGARLLAHAVNQGGTSYASGDIEISATQVHHPLLSVANAETRIEIGSSQIRARDIVVFANADAKYAWTLLDSQSVIMDTVSSVAELLLGVKFALAISSAKAEVVLQSGALLDAERNVSLQAITSSNATMMPIGLNIGGKARLAVAYGEMNATAIVDVKSGATIKASGLDVAARNQATLDVSVYSVDPSGKSFEAALAVTDADVLSSAKLASGAVIDVRDKVSVSAVNTNSLITNATAMALGAGYAGIAVAYTTRNTDAQASIGANLLIRAEIVTIEALDNTIRNKTTASGTAGSSRPVRVVLGATKAVTNTVGKFANFLLGRKPALDQKSGAKEKPKLAGALTIADTTHSASATIGDNAQIRASEDVVVAAKVEDARLQNHSISFVETKAKGDAQNPDATYSLSVAVSYGDYSHHADAHTGVGSQITAKHLGVRSDVVVPYEITWWKWEGLSTITSKINGNLGIANGFLTGFTNSATGANKIGLAGSVNYLRLNNDSEAYLGRQSKVTVLQGSSDNWTTRLPSDYLKDELKPKSGSLISWSSPVSIDARTDITGVFGASNLSITLNGAEGRPGAAVAGGTYVHTNYYNNTRAYIAEGAEILPDSGSDRADVSVTALSDSKLIAIAPSAGRGGSYGLNGVFALTFIRDKTEASVDDEAKVTADKLSVIAEADVVSWSVTGAFNKSDTVGVGLSTAVVDVDTDTKAFIGDNDGGSGQSLPKGEVRADSVAVHARTDGRLETISITGAVVSPASEGGGIMDKAKGALVSAIDLISAWLGNAEVTGKLQGEPVPPTESPQGPKFGLGVSGSVSLNIVNLLTSAYVEDAVLRLTDRAGSNLSVRAVNDTDIHAISGGGALMKAKNQNAVTGGAAGAIGLNIINNSTTAFIRDSSIETADDVEVAALSSGDQIAVGIGLAVNASANKDKAGEAAGSISVNLALNDAVASVEDSVIVGRTEAFARTLSVTAYDKTRLATGAGSAIYGGKGGFGGAITYAQIGNTTKALITGTSITGYDDVKVYGLSAAQMISGGAMGALTVQEKTGTLGGAIVITEVTNETVAEVIDGSHIDAAQQVDLIAEDTTGVQALDDVIAAKYGDQTDPDDDGLKIDYRGTELGAGHLSEFGGSSMISAAGVAQMGGNNAGLSLSWNEIKSTFRASIIDSRVGARDITVNARSNATILGLSVGAGIAIGQWAGAGAITVNRVTNTTLAEVKSSSNKLISGTKLAVKAEDRSAINSLAGETTMAQGKASTGLTIGYNETGNTTRAILDGIVLGVNESVLVSALNASAIRTLAISGAIASGVAVQGSGSVNVTHNITEAYIADVTTQSAPGTITVLADDTSKVYSLSGAGAYAQKAAVGGALAINTVVSWTKAYVSSSSLVLGIGSYLKVQGTNSSGINTAAAVGGMSDKAAVVGALNTSTVVDTTTAEVVDSQVNAGSARVAAEEQSDDQHAVG